MFIASLTYKASLEEIDKELNNHISFLKEQYAAGNFLASGRKVPRTGGIIMSGIKDKNELLKILEKDPFNQNKLADYDIVEFIPSMTSKELEFLQKQK